MSRTQYFTLGHSGLRVSRLALGAMTFGTDWGWGTDKDTARQMFNTYIDRGGNLIDTADLYTNGVSEQWVGEFVRERQLRDRVVITTKFGFNSDPTNPNAGGNGRKNMLRAVEGSLRRLNTDYIDLYLMHAWDLLTPVEEVMRTFDDLVRSGKVRHIGLSNVPAWYASRAQTLAQLRGREPCPPCSWSIPWWSARWRTSLRRSDSNWGWALWYGARWGRDCCRANTKRHNRVISGRAVCKP
jgi:aryl-alcohol dehydrogenase-like predicted oxidoreductase